ncbi:YaaC family protein [Streptomyces sp. CoH17]|uniref:YaaC family protein n=1 Tax=Streptomyces sp. CoH17 TaxID=2992806 RepID=UPI003B633B18
MIETSDISINSPGASLVALHGPSPDRWPHRRSSMKQELHPLMAWWAVLYTLSMLARYQPATWVKLISVDDSQHALPIERLLERAISHLPVLITDTITEIST